MARERTPSRLAPLVALTTITALAAYIGCGGASNDEPAAAGGGGSAASSTSPDGGGADAAAGDAGATICDEAHPDRTIGLRLCKPGVADGYVLYPHKHCGDVYLLDRLGRVVHRWSKSKYEPGQMAYLRENGNLVRAAMIKSGGNIGGGEGGRVEEYDWDDNFVWSFDYQSNEHSTHHDFKILPNGNLLMLAVERKSKDEAAAVGFDPAKLQDGYVAPDMVIEVKKTGATTFEVVWEWHVWDHLAPKGDTSWNPRLLVASGGAPAFWNHANSIDYDADLDEIVVSARSHDEVWILDHSTTTAEAASHAGGKHGMGGDFLYRWGNPAMYGGGTQADRALFDQHDAQWIAKGLPGAGHLLVFDNGLSRPGQPYSTLDEIETPVAADGSYAAPAKGGHFGPATLAWQYVAKPPTSFYASEISGVQRLPNGDTIACEGTTGRFFEVTPSGEMVWEYVNPVANAGPMSQYEVASLDPKTHPENAVFKLHFYPPTFAGFQGKDLTPGDVIERTSTTCPNADNPSYTCKPAADCASGGGTDVSSHFACASGGVCCLKLVQGAPPAP